MIEEERAGRYSDLFGVKHDHADSNSALCPLCATIGVLRTTKPEVREHLAAAARELITVLGLLLDEASEAVSAAEAVAKTPARPDDDGKVRRIDGS